jgi:hypothetical protein
MHNKYNFSFIDTICHLQGGIYSSKIQILAPKSNFYAFQAHGLLVEWLVNCKLIPAKKFPARIPK